MLHDTTQSLAYATMAQVSADGTSAAHSTLHTASFSDSQQPHAEISYRGRHYLTRPRYPRPDGLQAEYDPARIWSALLRHELVVRAEGDKGPSPVS